QYSIEQSANKAGVKLANFTCPARTVPLVMRVYVYARIVEISGIPEGMPKEICVPDKMCFWSTATRSGIQKQPGQGRPQHPNQDLI
ncbi:hypothetical protein D8Z12_24165, partial [Salmonella enterica subsp. enterica serovar Kentucky]|nr:hypothetical protein [Salmonella enterica subsp. enterica serovar Kentucky]